MERPGVGELWHGTIAVAHRHFAAFAVIAAVTVLLPSLIARMLFPEVFAATMANPTATPVIPPGFWLYIVISYIGYAIGLFSIAAVTADPDEGGGRTMATIIRSSLPAIGKAFLAGLLFLLAYILFVLALIIVFAIIAAIIAAIVGAASAGPGTAAITSIAGAIGVVFALALVPLVFWASARISPLTGVYLREPLGVIAGIKRAWNLSRGAAWTIIKIGMLLTLIIVGVTAIQFGLGAAGLTTGLGGFAAGLVLGLLGAALFVYQSAGLGYLYRRLLETERA